MTDDIHDAEFLSEGLKFQLYLEGCDRRNSAPGAERIRQSKRRALRLSLLWHAEINSGYKDTRVRRGATQAQRVTGTITAHRKAELFDSIADRFTSRLRALDKDSHEGAGNPGSATAGSGPGSEVDLTVTTPAMSPPASVRTSRRRATAAPRQSVPAQQSSESAAQASEANHAD
jgi:hypothetical protein